MGFSGICITLEWLSYGWLALYERWIKLGPVVGPVIQANGGLTFEDDLRSGGLLYFTTQ